MITGLRRILWPILIIAIAAPAIGQENPDDEPNIRYLRENADDPEVIVRPSGLQIKIIARGEGPTPRAESVVTVNYEGRLVDGTVFDSSYARGEPSSFPLDGVIEGWKQALVMMRIGSEWELVVPARLGYGSQGSRDVIPPGATLIFKVELLAIE